MTFEEILQQIIVILQNRGRVSYRVLKRQFNLDDDYLIKVTLHNSELRTSLEQSPLTQAIYELSMSG